MTQFHHFVFSFAAQQNFLLIALRKLRPSISKCIWSRRLDSGRKSTECCFDRSKRRWLLTKHGIFLGDREKIADASFLVVIVHNMLDKSIKLDRLRGNVD